MNKTKAVSLEEYYFSKLENDGRMNRFLKYFALPKNMLVFLILSSVSSVALERTFHLFFVSSVLAIYVMWECQLVYTEMIGMVDNCVVEETDLQQAFIVTDTDRQFILEESVCNFKNMSMLKKLKHHSLEMIISVVGYVVVYYLGGLF